MPGLPTDLHGFACGIFTTDTTDFHRFIFPGYPKKIKIAQIHPLENEL
jgi:hypothetical protein